MTTDTTKPKAERFKVEEYEDGTGRWGSGYLIRDTLTGDEIGRDGGEPEDQLLVRDWDWVPFALNRLADQVATLEAQVKEAKTWTGADRNGRPWVSMPSARYAELSAAEARADAAEELARHRMDGLDAAVEALNEEKERAEAAEKRVEQLERFARHSMARFPSRTGGGQYRCERHGEPSCESCLAYLMGDLRAALAPSQEAKATEPRCPSYCGCAGTGRVFFGQTETPCPAAPKPPEKAEKVDEECGHGVGLCTTSCRKQRAAKG